MMGQEREVVSMRMKTFPRARKPPELVAVIDYSALQVGDWFTVRGRSTSAVVKRSMRNNRVAANMEFEAEQISDIEWKFTRTK